ncbi:hypothetical protein MKX01_029080 [Papaver californicum]|nr:hypothetical protein MKX01_029080 [Papaver californicum]
MEVVAENHGESMMDKVEVISNGSESGEEEDEVAGKDPKLNEKNEGWFSSIFQSIAGKTNLEKSDLEPALKALKDRLLTKNVVCSNGRFVRMLTPKRSINVLRDVHVAREQGRPYVITFFGVNGVGKSTNFAKVLQTFVLSIKFRRSALVKETVCHNFLGSIRLQAAHFTNPRLSYCR